MGEFRGRGPPASGPRNAAPAQETPPAPAKEDPPPPPAKEDPAPQVTPPKPPKHPRPPRLLTPQQPGPGPEPGQPAPVPGPKPEGRQVPPLPEDVLNETNSHYLMDLADIHQRYNALERAEALLKRAVEGAKTEQDKSQAFSKLAGVLERMQDWKGSMELYEKVMAAEADPAQKANYGMRLANLYQKLEEHEKAEKLLVELSELKPAEGGQNLEWVKRMAEDRLLTVWQKQPGRLETVIKECDERLAKDPKDAAALDRLSRIYTSAQRDNVKAAEALEKLVALQPEDKELKDRLAAVYQANQQIDKALELYKQMLAGADPQVASRYAYKAGLMLARADRKDEGVALVKEHMDTKDANTATLTMLSSFYMQAQMPEEAESIYLKLAEQAKAPAQRADYLLRVADMAKQAKNYDKAEQQLRAILEQFKEDKGVKARANRALIQLYEQQGKVGELNLEK
ncbi:MAG: hypothetical protein M5U26_29980 [Planctomycetota bacterium]|nr:hypothetical protein [Planctomycetota bacterium]